MDKNIYIEKLKELKSVLENELSNYINERIEVYEMCKAVFKKDYDDSEDIKVNKARKKLEEIDKEIINANKVKSKFDIKAEKFMKILDIIADPVTIFDEPETESDEESHQYGFINSIKSTIVDINPDYFIKTNFNKSRNSDYIGWWQGTLDRESDSKISKEEYINALNERKLWLENRLKSESESYGFTTVYNRRIEMINKYIYLIDRQIYLCNANIFEAPRLFDPTENFQDIINNNIKFGKLSKYLERHIPNEREEFLGKVDTYIMKLQSGTD